MQNVSERGSLSKMVNSRRQRAWRDNRLKQRERLMLVSGPVAMGYLYWYQLPASRPAHFGELGLGIVFLGLLPTFMYFTGRATPPIPLMPLVGLFYALAFGFPVFFDPDHLVGRFQSISLEALLVTFTGIIAMLATYYGVRRRVGRAVPAIRLPRNYSESLLSYIVWSFIGIHLIGRLVSRLAEIPSVIHFTEPVGYIGYGMLLIWWYEKKISLPFRFLVIGLVLPIEIMSRLASGLLSDLARLGAFALLIVWLQTRKVPWKSIVLSLACFALLSEAKEEFRAETWYSRDYENASLLQKAALFVNLATKHVNSPDVDSDRSASRLLSRISQVGFLSHVVALTPRFVPYWGGRSYLNLFYMAIPRILWPDKPVETLNFELSKRYGMRSGRDATTSINVPWIVEMYANFGWAGTVIGMGLVGFLFAFLDARFNRPGMTPLESVFGATVCFSLCYQESNFSLMIGEKVIFCVLLVYLFRLLLGETSTVVRVDGAAQIGRGAVHHV